MTVRGQHWELDETGQPTQQILPHRRGADFITPIPKARGRRSGGAREEQPAEQSAMILDEGEGLSSEDQQYEHTQVINGVRKQVDHWREIEDPALWRVTAETARLLQHWRSHEFSSFRPFFCQIEAVETVIWLTEVAPRLTGQSGRGRKGVSGASDAG